MNDPITRSALQGGKIGGLAGAVGSVVSGAGVVLSTPAWLPFVGGSLLISTAAVLTGAAIGGGCGAAAGAVSGYVRDQQQKRQFREEFGDIDL